MPDENARIQYAKPPVVEALVDIIFAYDLAEAELDDLVRMLGEQSDLLSLPQKTILSEMTAQVNFSPGAESNFVGDTKVAGYRYSDPMNRTIIQLRKDGIAVSILPPYKGWSEMETILKDVIPKFIELTNPSRIQRVGIRYINRIILPAAMHDMSDYLTTRPEIGKGIPQGMSEYVYRVVVPNPETNEVSIISQGIDASYSTDISVAIIFDIDVFKFQQIEVNDTKALWDVIHSLRDFRTTIFENSITDMTKELFS